MLRIMRFFLDSAAGRRGIFCRWRYQMKQKRKTQLLSECAVLVALAFVLSYVRIITMPMEGSVTLLSMLPIVILSVRHGTRWGLGGAFVYALLQLVQSITIGGLFSWGLTPGALVGCILLDYLVPFTLLGLAGCFRKGGTLGVMAGTALVILLRYLSHVLSGAVIFAIVTEKVAIFGADVVFTNPWLYSLCYNGFYLLPELLLTLLGVFALLKLPAGRKQVFSME